MAQGRRSSHWRLLPHNAGGYQSAGQAISVTVAPLLFPSGMIFLFLMVQDVFFIEEDVFEPAVQIHSRLISKVRGSRITAFSACHNRSGGHFRTEFHSSNKAIAG